MLTLARRLASLAAILALCVGNAAACQGWSATPEARMACCTGEDTCPMHRSASHPAGTTSVADQSQADRCCAAAEGHESGAPVAAFVPSGALTPAATWYPLAQPARHPAPENWRVPLRSCPAVPTHVLLSVFLV